MANPECEICTKKRGVTEVIHRKKGGIETHRLMLCPDCSEEFRNLMAELLGFKNE